MHTIRSVLLGVGVVALALWSPYLCARSVGTAGAQGDLKRAFVGSFALSVVIFCSFFVFPSRTLRLFRTKTSKSRLYGPTLLAAWVILSHVAAAEYVWVAGQFAFFSRLRPSPSKSDLKILLGELEFSGAEAGVIATRFLVPLTYAEDPEPDLTQTLELIKQTYADYPAAKARLISWLRDSVPFPTVQYHPRISPMVPSLQQQLISKVMAQAIMAMAAQRTQHLIYLGIEIDLQLGLFLLPQSKINSIEGARNIIHGAL
eukprot:m51a1_g3535 hypothetical protein (259) ;mRNA; f:958161-967202